MSEPNASSETRAGGGLRRRRRRPRRAAVTGDGFEGRGALHRHLRLVAVQLRLRVLAALEYRTGFWSGGVLSLVWSIAGTVPLVVALEHRADIAGWTPWALCMLVGCHMIITGLFGALVQPSLYAAMDDIRTGALDYLLLRPVDALVSCLVADFEPWCLVEAVAGVGLLIVGMVGSGVHPSLPQLLTMALVLGCGVMALYALAVLALSLAFAALELQNLAYLMEAMLDFARWPISVFRGPLRALFTFVVPFAIMTSYPPMALLGRLDASAAVGALVTAVVLAGLARATWQRALRGYTSASS
ncbi:ABC transporter permease [Paraliomyxa miuraensis]|uniref:ABC transporter permease n=1 Tax=Paraliomyxa miuraensis TaxID=376150 RepID=UPI002254A9F1|nr:ABC-2 family transporter protein [Paraliomyxa miuraensis]MCX4240874.1 ABC-2 family transporter protein [Paraliomyxa miuraensis]